MRAYRAHCSEVCARAKLCASTLPLDLSGTSELWRLGLTCLCMQIGREQYQMFKDLVLSPLQTYCLFGLAPSGQAQVHAAPKDHAARRSVLISSIINWR